MSDSLNDGAAPSKGGTGAPLGDVTPETDATPALDGAAPDSRTFASRKREPCSLLAGAPIDCSELAEISGGDRSIEREMLAIFCRTNDRDVIALKAAVANQDLASVMRLSHRVKGAGKLVGARALVRICEAMEQAGRAGNWSAIAAHRDALGGESDRINAYLGTL